MERLFYVKAHTSKGDGSCSVFIEIQSEEGDNYITKEGETIRKDYVYLNKNIPKEGYNFYNVGYVPNPEYIYEDDSFKIEIGGIIYMYNEIRDIYDDLIAR